jgi:hypothetical protein
VADFDHILQFKITLRDVKPAVWRRIQVPHTYTFWDLHVAIQDAMGWFDYHLHEFEVRAPLVREKVAIGIPEPEWDDGRSVLPGWAIPVSLLINLANRKADYIYDFGDRWRHRVLLEMIAPREKDVAYPRCIGGKRACPPEDVGGPPGYEEMLQILANPGHPERESYLEWVGGPFDHLVFDPSGVKFSDPHGRLGYAFLDEEPDEVGGDGSVDDGAL